MGFLFSGKVEKALAKCKKKDMPLEVRYADGSATHQASLFSFDSKKMVFTGFTDVLREDSLEVSIPQLNASMKTQVTHTSHDIKGRILYHCPLPQDLEPISAKEDRYFIYPRGVVALAESNDIEEALGDNAGAKSVKFYIWDLTPSTMELVNSSGRHYETGYKFLAGKAQIVKVETMVELEVAYHAEKEFNKKALKILGCKFKTEDNSLNRMLEICKKIDSM